MDFIKKFLLFFNLDSELEHSEQVYSEIEKGVIFKGTNLWILIFAIIIASVGLNMNSTAVIIGAMLISPLMGPINGMGYSIATYDFSLFRKSLKNFSFAIIASLLASTTYFSISPVSTAHSELLARTSPTIYDVLIALFGGMAGIVAISSRQKGNVLPGVAIATALMPPLCTAGYGLATAKPTFFIGALYLFTINTIFIAIASVWISRLLRFPIRGNVEAKRRKNINRIITTVILVVLLPSIYFGYRLVQQEDFSQKAANYVSNIRFFEGNYLLNHRIEPGNGNIVLVYGGTTLSEVQKKIIIEKSDDFGLSDASITIEQGLALGDPDEKNKEVYNLKEEINNLTLNLKTKAALLDSIQKKEKMGQSLLEELSIIFPEVKGCSYAESLLYRDNMSTPGKFPVVVLLTGKELPASDKTRILQWLKKRLENEETRVYYEKISN